MTMEKSGAPNGELAKENPGGHLTRVGVECPVCQQRHILEINLDHVKVDAPSGQVIVQQLQEWLRSRCPDHLGPFLRASKN